MGDDSITKRYYEFIQRLDDHYDFLMDTYNWTCETEENTENVQDIQDLFIDFFFDILKETTDASETIRSTRGLYQCCGPLTEVMKKCSDDLGRSSSEVGVMDLIIDSRNGCLETKVRLKVLDKVQLSFLRNQVEKVNKQLTIILNRARDDYLEKLPKLIEVFQDLAKRACYLARNCNGEPLFYIRPFCAEFAPRIAKIFKKPFENSNNPVIGKDIMYRHPGGEICYII